MKESSLGDRRIFSMKRMRFNRGSVDLCLVLGMLLCSVPSSDVHAEDPPSAVGPVMKLFKSGRLPV